MQKVHIITIFDKNYLGRAMAFRESLHQHAPSQHVHFLCLDDASLDTARKLSIANTTFLRPEDLNDPELLASRNNRTLPEFASTCKPAFLLYMLRSGQVSPQDLLVFIDPDFCTYASPEPLWNKMYENGSIIVTPHRFPPHREHEAARKGVYNAGIVAFRNDANALACITEWRSQCIKWCYLRYENGNIADQGYMNSWPRTYKGVYELRDPGVNLANWNIKNHSVKRVPADSGTDSFLIDREPLIFYHFHGLKIYFAGGKIKAVPYTVTHTGIYKRYTDLITDAYKKIRKIDSSWDLGTVPHPGPLRIIKQTIWKTFS
jgi:hypothetical protein